VTLTLTLDRVEVTLVRICGRGLPTHQIRWKSEKLFVDVRTNVRTDGRTEGRTHLSSNLLGHRPTPRRWPKNWRHSTRSVVNLVRSQVYHAKRPPYLFAARSPWCSASRGFVSDSWFLFLVVTAQRRHSYTETGDFFRSAILKYRNSAAQHWGPASSVEHCCFVTMHSAR